MKYFFYFLIGYSFLACNNKVQQEERTTNAPVILIDESLQSWDKVGDVQAMVSDEVLTVSGNDGRLLTDQSYEDFIFETDFLIDSANKSAVSFRYLGEQNPDSGFEGYQVVIDHNADQQNTMGSVRDISRAKILKSTKVGDWNKLIIEARGDHLKVYINDTLVTETHDRKSEEGKIGLRAFGDSNSAKFRNMKITEQEEENYTGLLIEESMRTDTKGEFTALEPNDENDWYVTGDGVWDLNDGIIHGYSGEKGGFLIFKNTYQNFYLKLKFKIKYEDNSGIFIRHNPTDTVTVTTDNAVECNIYDHDGYLHEYSTGAVAPIARAWSKMIDYDSWNEMEIFAFDDHICLYINGVKSSETHLPEKSNISGNICIQAGIQVFNGNLPSDIYIKDLQIKDFDDVTDLGL